ncbi:E3 ubiquitin/ISG15 ligase TRIM25 isoform X2 [Xyrauchen texanus]|uniref:E3 ubiquitin/ISG15 ligase TRIM25 isoform X2 n=1 Tax=Xyrauchen texanus TaxID=154827 RepID=UPI00224275EA|nr:E3 ubiquitin/ISG15 ligase TRIM25 isoform X2 [Xyrauchen texanus]
MAENMSLLSLEDDLTCSICLCLFNNPVSLLCGHSFCASCLEASWNDTTSSLSCPNCRMHFNSRPDLKKNTVLSAVVDAYRFKAGISEPVSDPIEVKNKDEEIIKCDNCMEAKAVKTCLTCMASYCEDHVRPHRENAVFRAHQLSEPLPDLMDRLCPDHGKLMDLYCSQHQCCICSSCLQNVHKGCKFTNADDQRIKHKTDLIDKLNTLDAKTDKNQQVITQMKEQQSKLKEHAASRKRILEAEYRHIREMFERDEKEAMLAISKEQEKGQGKLASLIKKCNENVEKMSRTKSEINSLLDQSQSLSFLKTSVDLPSVVNFEPYSPRINVDSKEVIAYHSSAVALKGWISKILDQPAENRISILKPDGVNYSANCSGNQFPGTSENPASLSNPRGMFSVSPIHLRSPSPGAPLRTRDSGAKKKNPPQKSHAKDLSDHKERKDQRANQNFAVSSPLDNFDKRSDLLKYGTILNFDVRTAHKRIFLSENDTKATISDEPANYPDIPTRFSVCSQVLCTKGFSQGRHYWEIKMSSNNFCGLGLAYGRIDRKGPSSRLGRNAESWCVEWFNMKLSAWHNSIETVLANPNPSRVGIMLDCDAGSATFYNVQDRAYPFHTFVFPFSKPVYPAFWIFSNGSSVSLCKLTQ